MTLPELMVACVLAQWVVARSARGLLEANLPAGAYDLVSCRRPLENAFVDLRLVAEHYSSPEPALDPW